MMSWSNIANFPTGEAPMLSFVDGRLSFNTRNDDHVQTHESNEQAHLEINGTRGQNACLETTLNHNNEAVNPNLKNSSQTKGRKLTSKVWKEFIKYEGKDGKVWAVCKHCNKKFDGSSKNGTTHLNNHLDRCRSRRDENGGGQPFAYYNGDESHLHHGQEVTEVREQDCHLEPTLNLDNNEMENIDNNVDNPLGSGRRKLSSKVLEEVYEVENGKEWTQLMINQHRKDRLSKTRAVIKLGFSALNSIKADILLVYQEEKEKQLRDLAKFSGHFSTTVNCFGEHVFVVLYFIDDSWKLKRKILGCLDASGGFFSSNLKQFFSDWKIKKKVCSIVTKEDEEIDDETMKKRFNKQSSVPFGWQLLSVGWLVDLLKPCTWTGICWAAEKMKKCFVYARKTNEQTFLIAVDKAKSMGKKVISRDIPHWTFGFRELEIAVGFKEAFCELEQIDPSFKSINLTTEEWDKATIIYECLKVIKEAAHSLSESKYSTPNVYFPKVCGIYMKLLQWEKSENFHLQEVALHARRKFFDKFWTNAKLVLAAAVILDPRFKMDIVECWYREIYGSTDADGYLNNIIDDFSNIYSKYVNASYKMLDEMGRPCTSQQNSELDVYLKEPKVPPVEEFDILAWWHSKTTIFPILAEMARDILAVPISPTLIPKSFLKKSEFRNIIDCDGLDDDIKPALICSKVWLENCEDN